MERIAIVGLGLMGASLGLALKQARGNARTPVIAGYARRASVRKYAVKHRMVDEVFGSPGAAIRDAELVVFCVPILSIPVLVGQARKDFRQGCVVTDVGSTKAEITTRIERLLDGRSVEYVGSHPIAGSEKQGIESAQADLYRGAVVIVTATGRESSGAVRAVSGLWTHLGAAVKRMTPQDHDRIMARTSHLPHLAAALVASTAGREGDLDKLAAYCGPGFRDTTRIAEGSSGVWLDVFRSNLGSVERELKAFESQLQKLLKTIHKRDYRALKIFLEKSGSNRKSLTSGGVPLKK